jgi:hypothetical protein
MFVNYNGVHVSSDVERSKEGNHKEETTKQDWNILKKSSGKNLQVTVFFVTREEATLVNEEHVVYYDDNYDDDVEEEQILGNGVQREIPELTKTDSRSVSR